MDFLIPKKSPSLPSTPSSSYEEDHGLPATQATVTSFLYLKPDASATATSGATRPSLDKDEVLRRIRHRKRVNRNRAAEPSENAVNTSVSWLDDAFSSP